MRCQNCGWPAETRHVALFYNIGALILRFHGRIEGELCKRCIHKHYWQYTAINLFLGWWGIISFFFTFGFLIGNTVQYLGCLGMEPPPRELPPDRPDELSERALDQLYVWQRHILHRLSRGVPPEQVAQDYASITGCTEAQVLLYIRTLTEQLAG